MPTSGTYTWTTNTSTVINNAFRKINRLGDFESITAGDDRYDAGLAALNPILQANAADGMPMWAIDDLTINMSTTGLNTISGTAIGIGQTINNVAPLKLIQAIRRDNTTPTNPIDVPIEIYTWDYYNSLSQKSSTGAPVGILYQGPRSITSTEVPENGRIKLWPLPDSYWTTGGILLIRFQRPFQDQVATTGEFDFPNYWIHALTYQLAYALAPDYGLDPTQRGFLAKDAQQAYDRALGFGTETGSFNIQPATRWR
jgi:hypothetical protein